MFLLKYISLCVTIFCSVFVISSAQISRHDLTFYCLFNTTLDIYVDSPDSNLPTSSGILSTIYYRENVTCSIKLYRRKPSTSLSIKIRKLDIRENCQDYLLIKSGDIDETFCHVSGRKTDEDEVTTSNLLTTITLKTGPGDTTKYQGVEILYTAFTDNYYYCHPRNSFLCNNKRCIAAILQCDHYDHCGDNSDEVNSNCNTWPYFCRFGKTMRIQAASIINSPRKSSAFLRSDNYFGNASCSIVLVPYPNEWLLLSTKRIDLRGCRDKVTAIGRVNTTVKEFCGFSYNAYEKEVLVSPDDITIIFSSALGDTNGYSGFEFLFTSFKYKLNCASTNGLFQCDNGRCIAKVWRCDTHDQCGDRSDEKHCSGYSPYSPDSTATTIAYVIMSAVLLFATIVGITCCIRKKREREARRRQRANPVHWIGSNNRSSTDFEDNDRPPSYQEILSQPTPPPDYSQVQGVTNEGFKY